MTGITPALSSSARELVRTIVDGRSNGEYGVSFDVNYRSKLWPDASTAATTILPLAQGSDVIFIGDDEALELYDTVSPESLADQILRREDQVLVLKRGAVDASAITRSVDVSVPALPADVVDVTGAGDAFAAGYLAATCFEWPLLARLRLGHAMAARVIGHAEDTPPAFAADDLAALSPDSLEARWADSMSGGPR